MKIRVAGPSRQASVRAMILVSRSRLHPPIWSVIWGRIAEAESTLSLRCAQGTSYASRSRGGAKRVEQNARAGASADIGNTPGADKKGGPKAALFNRDHVNLIQVSQMPLPR